MLAGAQEGAGPGTGELAAAHDLGAVADHVLDAFGLGVEAGGACRQIRAERRRGRADGGLIEHNDIGVGPLGQHSPVH